MVTKKARGTHSTGAKMGKAVPKKKVAPKAKKGKAKKK